MKAPTLLETITGALGNKCPYCRKPAVFRAFLLMNKNCPSCGKAFERESGYFLGASVAAYFLGAFSLVPTLVISLLLLHLDVFTTVAFGTVQILLLTPFLFRYSRLIWLHVERRMTLLLKDDD